MVEKSLLTEGNGKKIYSNGTSNRVIMEFNEYVRDKNNKKKKVKDKAGINASISKNLFEYLNSYNVSNHFVTRLSDNELEVKKMDMVPIEILVRNCALGEFCDKYAIKEGEDLSSPVLEYYLKDETLNKPMMGVSHIYALNLATKEEMLYINKTASKINVILKSYFERRNLKLIDIRLEFGRLNGAVRLGDEISLDTFRVFDLESKEKLMPDLNKNLNLEYKKLSNRLIGEN